MLSGGSRRSQVPARARRTLVLGWLLAISGCTEPNGSILRPGTPGTPSQFRPIAWRARTLNPFTAAIIGDTVVAVNWAGDSIVAVSASTGTRLRAFAPTGGPLLPECLNKIAVSRTMLVASCRDIIGIDRRTLAVTWRRIDAPSNNQTVIGGADSSTVYLRIGPALAAALDARTGLTQWEREVPVAMGGGILRPATTGTVVAWAVVRAAGLDSGRVVGLDRTTGAIRFDETIPPALSPINRAAPLDGPVVLGSLLITSGFDGQLYALDPDARVIRWVAGADSSIAAGGGQFRYVVATPEMAIATSTSGQLIGYSASNGSRAFSLRIGSGGSILDRPVIDGDRLYISNLGGQLASVRLGATPTVEWTTSGFFPEKLGTMVGVTPTHAIVGEYSNDVGVVGVRR